MRQTANNTPAPTNPKTPAKIGIKRMEISAAPSVGAKLAPKSERTAPSAAETADITTTKKSGSPKPPLVGIPL